LPVDKQIEFLLSQEVHKKEFRYAQTRKELDLVFKKRPTYPDDPLRITDAKIANTSALHAYTRALREFSDLVVLGKVPVRLERS
jgi:hypothetical protein